MRRELMVAKKRSYQEKFNDKFTKKLRKKGLLVKGTEPLVRLFQSLGMLNDDVTVTLTEERK